MIKRFIMGVALFLAVLMCAVSLMGCGRTAILKDSPISQQPTFNCIYIGATIDEFNALGFEYGDSVDVKLSNGFEIADIPYYDGYYTRDGEYQLCAYPGYPYVVFCANNVEIWYLLGVTGEDTVTVTLNQQGKYIDLQNAMKMHMTNDRADYESDAVFANFRALTGGALKENVLFRSSSPIDNKYNRAAYVDDLMEDAGIAYTLNLADSGEDVEEFAAQSDFDSPYYMGLYNAGKTGLLALSTDFDGDNFKTGLAKGLAEMIENDGPYLINCQKGKDRTGFVSMLLEALAGASYDEIERDYMLTYDNFYGVSIETDSDRYHLVCEMKLIPMLCCITGLDEDADFENADYRQGARDYLLSGGMTDEQIDKLVETICD